MERPLVSILIPVHNAEAWLAQTLKSALGQTWDNIEIIVVDDGSSDESLPLARSFAGPRVKVLTQPNRGAAAARNEALRQAQGDFIQYLDADDLLASNKIAGQLAALLAAPADTIASGPWGVFVNDLASAVLCPEPVWSDNSAVEWLVQSWSGGGMLPLMVWLTPRKITDAAGPWDESLSLDDDGEYFTRVLLSGSAVKFVPHATSYYRIHKGPRISALRGRCAARSSYSSGESKERHLLAVENSSRTRHAIACSWQRFAWEQFVEAPALAADALARSQALAPNLPLPQGTSAYKLAARLLGWRLARRLQLCAYRLFRF